MRPFRLIAGFLTLSLLLGGALGDFFHVQDRNESQASDHSIAHAHSVYVGNDLYAIHAHSEAHAHSVDVGNDLYAIHAHFDGEGCSKTSPQLAIAPGGQRTSAADAIGVTPTLITHITPYQAEVPLAFRGRDAPLFEHASLFAATVSMRV